jgi:hypothetical protein
MHAATCNMFCEMVISRRSVALSEGCDMELRDRDSCVSTILGEVSNVLIHQIEHVDRVS